MSSVCIHQPLTESIKAFIVHRGTAKRLYTGTQCKAVVTGHSDKNNAVQSTHTKVYNCAKEHRMRLMQLFPLNLHSHSMKATFTPVRVKSYARLLLGSVEDAVPHWPRLDVCRPRRGETWTLDGCFAGGGNLIRRPGGRGATAGSKCRRFCAGQWEKRLCCDQADDVLFLPLPPSCGIQSHTYTGDKRKTFPFFYWSVSAPYTMTTSKPCSFVSEDTETIASVSYHNGHVDLFSLPLLSFRDWQAWPTADFV